MKKFKLTDSSLTQNLQKILGDDFYKAKAMWAIRPYDWGSILTSQKEIISPSRKGGDPIGGHCTCLVLVKYGTCKYAYVFIYWNKSGKKPEVHQAKGYPFRILGIKKERFQVSRSKLE